MFCAISGAPPINAVISKTSGLVYEKELILKYIRENEGKDPVTGESLAEDDLLDVKTSPSAPAVPPRPANFTSIPALLQAMQTEWDASMLEAFELRKVAHSLKQELSHALYKQDAAMRVLARVMRERDEAREALSNVQSSLGITSTSNGSASADVEMATGSEEAPTGVTGDAAQRISNTAEELSGPRRKRKAPASYAKADQIATYTQADSIPSLHNTKPPGIASLDVARDGQVLLTGGNDKNLLVYDRTAGKILATLKGHTKKIAQALFVGEKNGAELPQTIISASADKTVRLWKATDPAGKAKSAYAASSTLSNHSGEVTGIAIHPSQTLFASASLDNTWALHDLLPEDGPETILTIKLEEAQGGATAIAFHPDGALIAVGCNNSSISIFDVKSGAIAKTFDEHAQNGGGAVTSISFSENGFIMASSTDNAGAQVHVWDLRKLSLIKAISASSDDAKINAVRFDPSAQFLCAAGSSLRVWPYKSYDQPLLTFDDNAAELTAVDWADEGKSILVAGLDRAVRILSASA